MADNTVYYRPVPPRTIVNYVLGGIGLLLVLGTITTSYYRVDTDEKGVVLRFGKHVRTTESGLHFKLPFGIETVFKPKVKDMIAEFGYRTEQPGVVTRFSPKSYLEESLMLCGDLSIVDLSWSVQYQMDVTKPENYLFNVRGPGQLVRDVAESVTRSVVGDMPASEVLAAGKAGIQSEIKKRMQKLLDDKYKAGINITGVSLLDVTPPAKVQAAYNEVNAAEQEKERIINEANQERNRVVPRAEGHAQQMLMQAQAYAIDRVNRAKGDTARFEQILAEYAKSRDVTRIRMYLETMGEVLPKIEKKYIIDQEVKGLLPLMNVGEGK